MNTYQVTESAIIDAPSANVYAILADYHQGHPAILPAPYFTGLEVIEGGQGVGTMIAVHMKVFGTEVDYTMSVSEPEPGRILQEEDTEAGVCTTFTVDPMPDNKSCVTINTITQTSPGFKGWLEKMTNPPIARRIYRQELAQLAAYIANSENQTKIPKSSNSH